jgi:uncharacterized membrane-anchored protein
MAAMKLSSLRRPRITDPAAVVGTARADRRTRNLARRLSAGDIAVIDHVDIDQRSAASLVEAEVAAVINAAPSVSGRYPNLGPQVLINAGVPLLDNVGRDAFAEIGDGDRIRIVDDTVFRGDTAVACGTRQNASSVATALEASKVGLTSQLEAFSANAVEHLGRERDLLLDGAGVPELTTALAGRQVVVVVRAFDYATDIAGLRPYIKATRPVLIGVDAGADALLETGLRPDVVVTSADDISDRALLSGAELVYVAPRDGRQRTAERLERLGIRPVEFSVSATTEDAALLLAATADARLIVVAGSHGSVLEFLDRGRSSMASSFLTRTAVGSRLVDAKAAAAMYRNRLSGWWVTLVLLVAVLLVVAALLTTPAGQNAADSAQTWLRALYDWGRERVP